MNNDEEGKILKERAERSLGLTEVEILQEARIIFSSKEYVSTSALQMSLQIPFLRSSRILELLISEGFAIPEYDSEPRGVARVNNNKIKN